MYLRKILFPRVAPHINNEWSLNLLAPEPACARISRIADALGSRRTAMTEQVYREALDQHLTLFSKLDPMTDDIVRAGRFMSEAIRNGNKIMVCGNGGSAADAQHFAAEMVGRFRRERRAWAAIALTTDTSVLTAIGNDYSFNEIFVRQVEALAAPGIYFWAYRPPAAPKMCSMRPCVLR